MAQREMLTFSVDDFTEDPFDTSARTGADRKTDDDGNLYSIIKVQSPSHDDLSLYHFDFGRISHLEKKQGEELWIYVQKNAKRVKISRTGYATVDYQLPMTLPAGKNYKMVISSVAPVIQSQNLQFVLNPPVNNATILVERIDVAESEKPFGTVTGTPGVYTGFLTCGKYRYKIYADGYETVPGDLSLYDPDNTFIENVRLTSNAGKVTVKVAGGSDAAIYINNIYKDRRQWTGNLAEGDYTVEARKDNHTPTTKRIHITRNGEGTYEIPAPQPITEQVRITSTPSAEFSIDGVSYGSSPMVLRLLVGRHTITFKKDGYAPTSESFTVTKGVTNSVNVTLSKRTQVTVTTDPYDASLYLDGKKVEGSSPFKLEGDAGKHEIQVYRRRYTGANRSINFGKDNNVHIKLRYIVLHAREFYMSAGAGWCGTPNVAFTMGFQTGGDYYSSNKSGWNLEAYYAYAGLGSGKTVFFNRTEQLEDHEYVNSTIEAEYKLSHIVGARTGWAIPIGTRIKLTPQIGYRWSVLECANDHATGEGISYAFENCDCHSLTFGLRLFLATSYRCGFSLTPEYAVGVMKSDGYKWLCDSESKFKSYCEGFGINLSFVLTF